MNFLGIFNCGFKRRHGIMRIQGNSQYFVYIWMIAHQIIESRSYCWIPIPHANFNGYIYLLLQRMLQLLCQYHQWRSFLSPNSGIGFGRFRSSKGHDNAIDQNIPRQIGYVNNPFIHQKLFKISTYILDRS